jgi:hypothetical protein
MFASLTIFLNSTTPRASGKKPFCQDRFHTSHYILSHFLGNLFENDGVDKKRSDLPFQNTHKILLNFCYASAKRSAMF